MLPFFCQWNRHDQELFPSSVLRMVRSCPLLRGRGLLLTSLFFGSTTVSILIFSGNLLFSILYICLFVLVLRKPLPMPVISVTCMSKLEGRAIKVYLGKRGQGGWIISRKSSGMETWKEALINKLIFGSFITASRRSLGTVKFPISENLMKCQN